MVTAREAFEGESEIEVKSSASEWICLCLAPHFELKQKVVQFFRSQMADLSGDLCERLSLALDELLGNAIEHGSKAAPQREIEISYIRTHRMVLVHLRDPGSGFSLNEVPHAAVNNPPEDPLRHTEYRSQLGMRPGGFGILLVKQIADELIYNERGNEVLFVKYL